MYVYNTINYTNNSEINLTFFRVPVGRNNLTVDGGAVGCGRYNSIISIPVPGITYEYSVDLGVTGLTVLITDALGSVISGANVTFSQNSSVNCTTESNGICTLYYIPDGNRNVTVRATNYQDTNKSYFITSGSDNDQTSNPVILFPNPGK